MKHLLACIALLAGCSSSVESTPDASSLPEVDPTGNWTVTYAFEPACGNPASTTTSTFTVTFGAMGFDVEVAGVVSTGSLLCEPGECRLSGTFAWMAGDAVFQQSMNLHLSAGGDVTGGGTEAVITQTSQCTYSFTATGSRS